MALKRKLIFSVVFIFVAHIACGQVLQVADKKEIGPLVSINMTRRILPLKQLI